MNFVRPGWLKPRHQIVNPVRWVGAFCMIIWGGCLDLVAGENSTGLFVQSFSLTLEPGWRREAIGPFYSYQESDTQVQWTVNPFVAYVHDPDTESTEVDFLYPLVTYDRTGKEYRLQFGQLFSLAGGQYQGDQSSKRFTLFPLYFSQRSTDTNENYTALLPFYGRLKNRIWRDETEFIMYPFYVKTRKKDLITENYFLPFYHQRRGNALTGWQLWPLVGNETKGVTTRTNVVEEIEIISGHTKFFALWPLYFDQHLGLGTPNLSRSHGLLPFYAWHRSPQRESSSYLWPVFTYTVDRERHYREWDCIWPFLVFARGEGKTMNRLWPFYGMAYNTNLQSDFFLWPLYKHNRLKTEAMERDRTRILFYLYSDLIEKLPGTNQPMRRTDLWPLFAARRDHNGNERLQILALLESVLPQRKSLERNYSPLWSLWRYEKNGKTGAESRSWLWNFCRWERNPDRRKGSLFFGLIQYHSTSAGTRWRFFYWPSTAKPEAAAPRAKS